MAVLTLKIPTVPPVIKTKITFLSDAEEDIIGTDPNNPDTDGDGILDGADDFPLDPNRS